MTPAGESAVAGLLRGLPEAQGILCGSIVSGLRTRPGNWAGPTHAGAPRTEKLRCDSSLPVRATRMAAMSR
ncbi:glutamine synthetase, catalytic domain protein [Mycobacterium xenopi 4042]|uniref:Glutamine synthetase, catalytic domain protein n=1 Tax=Mycobacterium xenopi 4042 TaxID=1299334 RepID=X8BHE6_MYCXE|nr:glutamine synthetase, catalytic domain protein [Mycobacterium xenopi 4042]